jgi:site-specific DNA-methyltransferase (adenine-specific)
MKSALVVLAEGKAKTVKAAEKVVRRKEKTATVEHAATASESWAVHHADLREFEGIASGSIDWVITDPPYPREYLPLYGELGRRAAEWLKPGGSLVCMVGQSYLPDVLALLGEHLRYHWTLAYLTPGGQAVHVHDRNVNAFWKPLVWFVKGEYAGACVGDVAKSPTNANDKRFHDWGQSERGMADIVDRFTKPGELVCDPFAGAGTTGLAAVAAGRRFVGMDVDAEHVARARARIAESANASMVE